MHSVGKPTEFKTKPWNIVVKCNFFWKGCSAFVNLLNLTRHPQIFGVWTVVERVPSDESHETKQQQLLDSWLINYKQAKNCIALQEFAKETPGTKWETESSRDYRWRWPQPHGNSIKRFWKEINLIYYSSTYLFFEFTCTIVSMQNNIVIKVRLL